MKMNLGFKRIRAIICVLLVFAMVFGVIPYYGGYTAEAKTTSSATAENIFFYVTNSDGKDVLLRVMPLAELENIAHGQLSGVTTGSDTGTNYYFSSTDNLPAVNYAEGKGFTLPELVAHVKSSCTAVSSPAIAYSGGNKMYFMATDSHGAYNRNWTYEQLYGVNRYYFPGIYNASSGWTSGSAKDKPGYSGWEVTKDSYTPSDANAIPLDYYNSHYSMEDPYYSDKRTAFNTGVTTTAILAVTSASGRISSEEVHNAVAANGGIVTGCMKDRLTTESALMFCLPQTEAVLMSGNRTAYHFLKWIYNIKLQMTSAPATPSKGTVAAPTAEVTLSPDGDTMYVSMSCATAGASIYYSFEDGAPQILYPGSAVAYDARVTDPKTGLLKSRDFNSNPVRFYMRAVKGGYDDAGIIEKQYYAKPPAFDTVYNGAVGSDLVFNAASSVSSSEWNAWSSKISGVEIMYPTAATYSALTAGADYTINDTEKSITFHKSLFSAYGAHSFLFTAADYANMTLSVSMTKTAPALMTESKYYIGSDLVIRFDDTAYQLGTTVRAALKGSGQMPDAISDSYLDTSIPGRLTIRSGYFSSAGCAISSAGIYTLTLENSSFTPSSRTVDITVAPASEKPVGDTFTYALSPGASGGTVGNSITVKVLLNSNKNSYLLYGGGYRIILDDASLELGNVNAAGTWQSGTKAKSDGTTILTFGTLDRTGNGVTTGAVTDVGSFSVKLLKAGSATIQITGAALTDSSGAAREGVSGNNLSLTIPNASSPGDTGGAGGGGGGGGDSDATIVTNANGAKTAVYSIAATAVTGMLGKAQVEIPKSIINIALTDALSIAADADKKAGKPFGTTAVEVKLNVATTDEAKTIETALPVSSLKTMAASTNAKFTVSSPIAEITLDHTALEAITANSGETATLSTARIDSSTLPEAARQIVGDAPVYDLKVVGAGGTVSDFNGGSATVSIPYKLKAGESASGVTVYYINSAGELTKMNCTYNPDTGMAAFVTGHFSYYAVVAERGTAFSDVDRSAYYFDAVNYAVKNGILKGTGSTTFSPAAVMTRAMFVTALGRAGGVNAAGYGKTSFSDVAIDAWYGGYVEWAYRNNIVSGVGNGRFSPDQQITRDQMAAILTSYCKWKGITSNSTAQLTYTDLAAIPSWAREGMTFCTAKGWITGYPDGSFLPRKTATRAEAATVLYKSLTVINKN